jgi:hypothetical protein
MGNALHPRLLVPLLTVAVALSATPGHAVAKVPYPGETLDPSGIALVGPTPYQVVPKNEQQALAFDQALTLAENNGNDMGYPWLDTATGTLELSVTTDKGRSAAMSADANSQISQLPQVVTTAQASFAQLNRIQDAVSRLNAQGVPNSDLIYMSEPDQEHNRIVITVSSLNEGLMLNLASRFGTGLIAVRVQGPRPEAHTADSPRNHDSPPFWGGAYWQDSGHACTTGFAWYANQYAMLTAGHCAPDGAATVSFSGYGNVGSIASGTNENWSDSTGSELFQPNGQSGCCDTYHGDLALVRLPVYKTDPTVYAGSANNPTSVPVGSMYPHHANIGDKACVDGRVTGEWCDTVINTGVYVDYYSNGPNVVARNVDVWQAWNLNCISLGDSGGPVYQYRSDGKVEAMGIISGYSEIVGHCLVYFTDIWDAWYGLPGAPLTTG